MLHGAVKSEDGQLLDIIAGDFFICYAPIDSETWLDLPPDLEKKYMEKFDLPEQFFRENGEIGNVKYDPGNLPINRKSVEYER